MVRPQSPHPHDVGNPPAGSLAGHNVLDHVTTAILLFDDHGLLLDMNPAAEELLDNSIRQIRGSRADSVFIQAEELCRLLARVIESGESIAEKQLEAQFATTAPMSFDCAMTPWMEPGAGLRVVVELNRLDTLQAARQERLLEENETTRAVLRGLAHEIRNPLSGLRGAAQLLERELDEERLREYTGVIIGEADRLEKLLDNLLGPHRPPQLRPINIHQVTERVYTLLQAEVGEGVHLDRDYDPSLPLLDADPELLIQALLNVGRNAVQALEGAGTICLRTRILRQCTLGHRQYRLAVRIDVIDDGPGIPAGLGERIFYPLVTGRSEGTGLGLSIAQALVHQHAGLIEWDSQAGSTRFSLLLPLRNSELNTTGTQA